MALSLRQKLKKAHERVRYFKRRYRVGKSGHHRRLAHRAGKRLRFWKARLDHLKKEWRERKVTYGAGGWAPTGTWWMQRVDQGQDFEIPLNYHVRAPGDGEVVDHAHDRAFPNGFGDPYAIVRIDTGRFAGRTYYIGHCNADVPPVGLKFKKGDLLSRANNSLSAGRGWIELGLWPPGSMSAGYAIHDLFTDVTE